MNKELFLRKYWYYYLQLEDEFLKVEKFIPIDTVNFNAFSYNYLKLLSLICIDVDRIFQQFIDFKSYPLKRKSIKWYDEFIKNNFHKFNESSIICYPKKYYNITLNPFIDWKNNKKLSWWNLNEKIKHDYDGTDDSYYNFKSVNQLVVLNALSGLFQLNMYFYKEIICDNELWFPLPQSKIFYLTDWDDYFKMLISPNLVIDFKKNKIVY